MGGTARRRGEGACAQLTTGSLQADGDGEGEADCAAAAPGEPSEGRRRGLGVAGADAVADSEAGPDAPVGVGAAARLRCGEAVREALREAASKVDGEAATLGGTDGEVVDDAELAACVRDAVALGELRAEGGGVGRRVYRLEAVSQTTHGVSAWLGLGDPDAVPAWDGEPVGVRPDVIDCEADVVWLGEGVDSAEAVWVCEAVGDALRVGVPDGVGVPEAEAG